MLKIQHGEIPKDTGRRGRAPHYPFRTMNIGDYFDAPDKRNIRQILYGTAKYVGIKISVRMNPDGTVRVWRVE